MPDERLPYPTITGVTDLAADDDVFLRPEWQDTVVVGQASRDPHRSLEAALSADARGRTLEPLRSRRRSRRAPRRARRAPRRRGRAARQAATLDARGHAHDLARRLPGAAMRRTLAVALVLALDFAGCGKPATRAHDPATPDRRAIAGAVGDGRAASARRRSACRRRSRSPTASSTTPARRSCRRRRSPRRGQRSPIRRSSSIPTPASAATTVLRVVELALADADVASYGTPHPIAPAKARALRFDPVWNRTRAVYESKRALFAPGETPLHVCRRRRRRTASCRPRWRCRPAPATRLHDRGRRPSGAATDRHSDASRRVDRRHPAARRWWRPSHRARHARRVDRLLGRPADRRPRREPADAERAVRRHRHLAHRRAAGDAAAARAGRRGRVVLAGDHRGDLDATVGAGDARRRPADRARPGRRGDDPVRRRPPPLLRHRAAALAARARRRAAIARWPSATTSSCSAIRRSG